LSFDPPYDDKALLRLMANDDMAAFEQLYHHLWQSLFNAAHKRLKNVEQSKDIVQDVFADLWLRRGKVEIENLPAYLNTAIRFQVYKRIAAEKSTAAFLEPFESIATSPFDAGKNIADKELAELAKTWFDTLPEKRKAIFLLHFVEKLSTQEIAERLHISQKTVQNQIGTAVKSLRRKIIPVFF
jgi:RNA polymerase sigma-70 factor (family 1)